MDQTALESIRQALSKHDKIGIAVGSNPGIDEMGAALALYLCLKQAGKQVSIASPSDPLVAVSSLVGVDKVKKTLSGEGGDLVVAFPYTEGEIEKVSYTLENGYLNIIVKASKNGLTFNEQEVKYTRSGGAPSLLFIIGTPRISDLGDLYNPDALKDTTVVNIDNKSANQGYGDIVFVSPRHSSVCEQVATLIQFLGLDFDVDTAQNLLSGIVDSTNNFSDLKTTYTAFEMAATLMKAGAVRARPIAPRPVAAQNVPLSQFGFQPAPRQFGQPRRDQRPDQRFDQRPRDDQGRSVGQPARQFTPTRPADRQQSAMPRSAQPQPQSRQQVSPAPEVKDTDKEDAQEAPPDWLTPKVYKGSTLV